jgi:hypothetical protein
MYKLKGLNFHGYSVAFKIPDKHSAWFSATAIRRETDWREPVALNVGVGEDEVKDSHQDDVQGEEDDQPVPVFALKQKQPLVKVQTRFWVVRPQEHRYRPGFDFPTVPSIILVQ